MNTFYFLACFLALTSGIFAQDDPMQSLLNDHVSKYQELEYFSGASLSVFVPGDGIKNYYAGRVSRDPASAAVGAKTLFQIGSITKSFTAALMLQLEKENKVNLQQTLGVYVPQYDKWGKFSLNSLLNMTSCLPNYSDTPLFNVGLAVTPEKSRSTQEIIAFVYPHKVNPPLRSGYMYSNTGYVLCDMVVEKVTGNSFKQELENKIIKPCNLGNTFYPLPTYSPEELARMAHGYQYNIYDNPELVGKDVTSINLTWAGAAGALLSTTEDIIKWVQMLFTGNLLDAAQKQQLMAIHSLQTGKPIATVTKDDPEGFGLGVVQSYGKGSVDTPFWFYEGQTIGFRAIYMYIPAKSIIVACAFNSSTDSQNDHAHELLMNVYSSLK
ncbi:MAG: beta-lactamase family protein [Chlamydiales bacterium]|nr:beta-lactamase family protein [Chlamydiales bacterium]